jgi:hypothetical protein
VEELARVMKELLLILQLVKVVVVVEDVVEMPVE